MSSLIKISEAAALALHAMTLMASENGRIRSNRQIAEVLSVSEAHLSKVLQRLTKTGLVRSVRGPTGGFILSKKPEDVSLLQIFEVVEGPYTDTACMFSDPRCQGRSCILDGLLMMLDGAAKSHLEKTTLSDLSTVSFG